MVTLLLLSLLHDFQPGEPDGMMLFVPFEDFQKPFLVFQGDHFRWDTLKMNLDAFFSKKFQCLDTEGLEFIPDAP
jgi:hypothetical protein